MPALDRQSRHILLVLLAAGFGFVALPWYGIPSGFWSFAWLQQPAEDAHASGILQALLHGRFWLLPLPALLLIALTDRLRSAGPRAAVIAWCGGRGLAYLLLQGFAVGLKGWTFAAPEQLFGPVAPQAGMGAGAFVVATSFLLLLSAGLALKGYMRG